LGNPNNYVIAPQFLNLAWQPFPQWQVGPVRFRGQILATFAGEAIVRGPESYFLGGPAVSLRLSARRFAMVLLCGWRRGHGGCGQ
jgi:hypothetical protein